MNRYRPQPARKLFPLAGIFVLLGFAPLQGFAQAIWTNTPITFTHLGGSTTADTIVPGKVVLTRGSRDVLYNTAAGELGAGLNSPLDVGFAFVNGRDISTAPSFSYQSMESFRSSFDVADTILNKPMVMKLTNENIYIPVTFTVWGRFGSFGGNGAFTYNRGTAPAAVAPTVSITSPSAGATLAAPASVKLSANASVSGGTVSSVQYFAGATSLGSATTSPFNVTGSLPNAGPYSLTAVATAGGVLATSAAVNITVVTPVATSLSAPKINNGQFSFQYTVNPGLSYVVERASHLPVWAPVVTNTPASSPATYSESFNSAASNFYRVGRLPNP